MQVLVWLIVILLFAYIAMQLYQAWRLNELIRAQSPKKEDGARAPAPADGRPEDAPAAHDDEDLFVFEKPAAAQAAGTPAFGEQLQFGFETQQLRQDIAQLQAEVAVQRKEFAAFREQFDSLLAAQNVSPEYNEALILARRGLDADAIAERCGISVAEAGLVHSLARQGKEQGA